VSQTDMVLPFSRYVDTVVKSLSSDKRYTYHTVRKVKKCGPNLMLPGWPCTGRKRWRRISACCLAGYCWYVKCVWWWASLQ